MIYLDNAATSFPKPRRVISALNECVREYCGNPGRSAHSLSFKCSERIFETRARICSLLNYPFPENVVFTLNASYALNLAIKTTLKKGDHVLISDIEHNSVIRPLEAMRIRGEIEYSVFKNSPEFENEMAKLIRPNTSCIISSLSSNVTGEIIPLKSLSNLRQKYNLKLIVDASQAIGHRKIDLNKTPVDVLCAPSHKALFGIQGSGFCIFCDRMERESFIEGGSGSESISKMMPTALPEHFEAGTLPTPAIVSLYEGLGFINDVGVEEIESELSSIVNFTIEKLLGIRGISIYGGESGIISFTHEKLPPHLIAQMFDSHGIAVRSGLHCAPIVHERLGTLPGGTVRISFSYFTKKKEVCKLIKVLSSEIKFYY